MNEQELETIREKLRDRCSFFADPDLPGRLQWFEFQECDVVITQEAAQKHEEANAAYRRRQLKEPPCPPPAAIFGAIVCLSEEHFITACSDWNPDVTPRRDGPRKLAGDFEAGWVPRICGTIDWLADRFDDFYDPYTAIPPTPMKRVKLNKEEGEEGQACLY
ncbi:hypothetical protein H1R20_g2183, partial [Candolleomyces eurysporus]